KLSGAGDRRQRIGVDFARSGASVLVRRGLFARGFVCGLDKSKGRTMSAITWLGEEACHLDELVGGKAAALSRFAAKHAVPAGFAVPALSPHAPMIAVEVADAIASAYHALAHRRAKPEVPVAVRSSALYEDGGDAS